MNKSRVFLAGLIVSLFVGSGVAQAADKFAYIDLSRTFSEYNKTKDYDKVLSFRKYTINNNQNT